jgi:hypothetical protein
MVPVTDGAAAQECDPVGPFMLNQHEHPMLAPAAIRFDSLLCLNHHSNFRPIFATLGRGAGRTRVKPAVDGQARKGRRRHGSF